MLRVRNPHSVLAALEARPSEVTEIILPPNRPPGGRVAAGDAWEQVARVAKAKGVRVSSAGGNPGRTNSGGAGGGGKGKDRDFRDSARDSMDGRTSAAEGLLEEREGVSAEELFEGARERADGKGLWLALDCLQDPHNVGAIFRTAAFFGVQGILMTQERSAPLTAAVYDVACGGMECVPFTVQPNLQRGFEKAKEAGLWILGASEHAKEPLSSIQRDRPWLLVIGNEEIGMRRLTEEACDVLCKIPPVGRVTSLNASVAASILIHTLSG
jgi:23S rRNA (guanosine2251-2'-O)-methyltransferase